MWTSDEGAEEPLRGSRGEEAPITLAPPLLLTSTPPPTLVLGLGNPILGDDGVGWRVVEAVQEAWRRRTDERPTTNVEAKSSMVHRPHLHLRSHSASLRGQVCAPAQVQVSSVIEFDFVSLGGLALMERLIGCDRAILVDAIQTRDGVPGAIYRLTLDDLPTLHADAIHDASLKAALAVGRHLGAKLPREIVVIGIEAINLWDFSETLSPQVAASVPRAAERVLDELANGESAKGESAKGESANGE
jgi:hydrogenase maturation protease